MIRANHAALAAIIAVAGWLHAVPARGQQPAYGPELQRCLDNPANQGTMGMVGCYDAERRRWEARLNQEYRATLGATRPEAQARLRAAQRLWLQFRDANCAVWGMLEGGSIDAINGAECLLRLTAERVAELERMRS